MTDNSKRTGAAIGAHYQFIAWLVPNGPVSITLEKFLAQPNACLFPFACLKIQ
jgi:hypothetical protein